MRQDLLDLDPFSAAPSVPPDVRQFAELTGVDHATATRYLDAVKAHADFAQMPFAFIENPLHNTSLRGRFFSYKL